MNGQPHPKDRARQDKEALAPRVRQALVCTSKLVTPKVSSLAPNSSKASNLLDAVAPVGRFGIREVNSFGAFVRPA